MLPVKLEIDNFMSYEKATLEFDFSSALFSGKNGSGKSTIFNAIEWALWGETRHKSADSVVKRGQSTCRVAFFFTHDGKTYRIIRTRSVKQSKMEVEFDEVHEGGLFTTLSHDTNKATDAEIRRVLRSNHEVFINSSYFRQNSFFDFVQGTFGSRQAIIGSLLNLDKWNKYHKSAKDTFVALSAKIDGLKADLERLGDLPAKLERAKLEGAEAQARLAALELEESATTESLRALQQKISESKDEAHEYARFQELLAREESQKKSIASSKFIIHERKSLLQKLQKDATEGRQSVVRLTQEIATISEELTNRPVVDVAKLEEAILGGKSEFKILSQQIANLLENDSCQMCGHEWADLGAKNQFLEELKAKRTPIEEKLKRAEPKLATIKEQAELAKRKDLLLEKRTLQKVAAEKNVELLDAKNGSLETEIAQIAEQLTALESKMVELQALLKTAQEVKRSADFQELERKIEAANEKQKRIRKEAADTSFKLGSLTQEEKFLTLKIAELKQLAGLIADLTKQATMYGQLARAFSKDGIQAIIIDNIIEELTTISNYWLHQFSNEPIYIGFVTQKKNTKGDWRETFDIEIHTPTGTAQWEDFSGGEQFRIGFAIRLAFSTIQAKRMGGEIQMLMLDEVSTSLDADGLESFVAIIRRLEKDMKVMVITHDDKLKEEFQTIINVNRNLDGSRLD